MGFSGLADVVVGTWPAGFVGLGLPIAAPILMISTVGFHSIWIVKTRVKARAARRKKACAIRMAEPFALTPSWSKRTQANISLTKAAGAFLGRAHSQTRLRPSTRALA